nr:ribosomal protein L7Ae/L30e/S12e/Gadd45 [Tanacetum cinerariifolium]
KEKLLQQEQWAYLSTHPSKRLTSFCYDDDDDDDYNSAITPVLSIEEPIDSLSMGDEHLDTIPATESDEVIKSSVEGLVPIPSESEGIPEHKCDVPFHDNSPPLDVLNDQIEDFSESNNEVPSIDDDSFSIVNIDTTTHSDISLPDYEAFSFDDDHIKEISSGSPTTHFDISLSEYDSFIFNLTHKEFIDKLAHIISPPEYDRFYFKDLPDQDRTIKSQTVSLNPNQILTKELSPDMKQWEELIRENAYGLGGHGDRLLAYHAHMLYCVVVEEQNNLAYFFVKRIKCAKATPTANLPYGMFLTRLY